MGFEAPPYQFTKAISQQRGGTERDITTHIIVGDARTALTELEQGSVHCCVTSPPYFGLRDYGMDSQIGLEKTPDAYIAEMVSVFREVKRVLRDDGTLWLNIGDSYDAGSLLMVPARLALALKTDGWFVRSDIIWHKTRPMPESVRNRPSKAHEYLFLLSKSAKYYYDAGAIAEPLAESSVARLAQNVAGQEGSSRVPGKTNGNMKAVAPRFGGDKYGDLGEEMHRTKSGNVYVPAANGMRNKRTVWSVAPAGFKGAHFATMPPKLVEPCVLAGCPVGGTVLDPFGGSGTTALVANMHGRNAILVELNPAYAELARQRVGE